jgi:ATP-binding cassette, sub-family E, member 1
LDSEQRIIAAKVIKRFIRHAKKTAFIIEHDFIMATYLADRVIVFEGSPAIAATATPYDSFFLSLYYVQEKLIAIVFPQTTITPHGDE